MNNLRRWIIRKLGGFTIDDIHYKDVVEGYWDKVLVSGSLYISPCDYTKENSESIERELANQIGAELLRRECIFFQGPFKDHDELRISAMCASLKLHERESYNIPNHLIFKEED